MTETIKEEKIFDIIENNFDLASKFYNEFSRLNKGSWVNFEYPNLEKLIKDISD